MGDEQTNISPRLVACSFCNENFSPSAIREHLMMCGNKTDQCPNCKKYIRRAVFAYHYENQCANLEESETDARAAANQRDTSSTFQPNNPSQSPSRSATANNKQMSVWDVDLPTHPGTQNITSQRSDSGTTNMVCPYCNYECDPAESEIHQENCLRNPQSTGKKQQPRNDPTFSQNADRLNRVDEAKDTDEIPCEVCNRLIKWSDYRNHIQACPTRLYPRIEEPRHVTRYNDPGSGRCIYCEKGYMIATLEMHQKSCKKNPFNIALEEQHRSIFYPPGCPFY